MVFKLLLAAEQSWRKLNGAELVALVRAGVKFVDGVREERDADADTTRPTVAKSKTRQKQLQDAKVAA